MSLVSVILETYLQNQEKQQAELNLCEGETLEFVKWVWQPLLHQQVPTHLHHPKKQKLLKNLDLR